MTDAADVQPIVITPEREEPLTLDKIVAGLELERDTLVGEIKNDSEQITRLEALNSQRRGRLRQVKRMLTAAKPTRSRAKTSERPPKAAK